MPGKLLVIHSSNEMFGSDQVLLRTVLTLKRAGWQPLILLPNDLAYTGDLSRELIRQDIPVRILPLGILRRKYLRPLRVVAYGVSLLWAMWTITRIIRAEKIKVVYSATGAVVSGALAAAWTRRPHVWHIHEIPLRPRWMVKLLGHFYAAFSSRLIAVSRAVLEHWCRIDRRMPEKMTVIHNGVDVKHYSSFGRRAALRRRLGAGPEEVLVGCLGRIGTWKGQEVLLQALARMGAGGRRVKGIIAGGTLPGEEFKLQTLRDQIRTLGLGRRAVLHEFQKDVRPILEVLDIVVVPSVKPEPFGMVILEAMAFGLPVIATNIGGSPEVVVDGHTGYLVPPNDPQALADTIQTLARSARQRERFGQAGRRRVTAFFSLKRYQDHVVRFFAPLGA
jgi:glycosyltransferase involved in cell wall biosynthesis